MKILVIDDDDALRRLVQRMLQPSGWEVLEAPDGERGVLQAKAHLPDLILCDFSMEGIDGHQTLALLRAIDATATIPFVLMTGEPDRASLRRSMELGADDYLTKPFDHHQLTKCVEARIARARLARQQAEQKLAALRTSIVAAVPHALKTPLNGIVGFAELLATDYDSFSRADIREMVQTIHESAVVLDQTVDRFLAYTDLVLLTQQRPAGGTPSGAPPAEAAPALRAIAQQVSERHGRQADLVLELGPARPAMPRHHLERLAAELIDNACRFSPPRSRLGIVTAGRGDRFILEIHDEGPGLTPEQIGAAGALLPLDGARPGLAGTGLGLATARLLADLHGGELAIDSPPGRGTTVKVTLPAAP